MGTRLGTVDIHSKIKQVIHKSDNITSLYPKQTETTINIYRTQLHLKHRQMDILLCA